MIIRLIAIAIIYLGTTIAWMVLGGSIFFRTSEMDSVLGKRVGQIWGVSQTQKGPRISYPKPLPGNRKNTDPLSLTKSDVRVLLQLEHRKKGLLWFPVYRVKFNGNYNFINTTKKARLVTVSFSFPTSQAIYDDFILQADGRSWENELVPVRGQVKGQIMVQPGEEVAFKAGYRSQGMKQWKYDFGGLVSRVRNFQMVMETDFDAIDFPSNTISPAKKEKTDAGWRLIWEFRSLVSGVNMGMSMPNLPQPGLLAGRISFFAPVSLFFFITVMMVVALVGRVGIHPMHFFFLSAAFFTFHLLIAYLVDHLSIHLSFAIGAVISVSLVFSYLWMAIGRGFALKASLVQIIYLVLFSYTFFLKGFTGLSITIGTVLTLFVLMQMTARVNWTQVFAKKPNPPRQTFP